MEETPWGGAGIALAILGTTPGVAASSERYPRADRRVDPAVLRLSRDVALAAFCVSEPDAGSDVSSMRTRAVYDEAS